ncbi:type II secretion system F family protein [Ferdinandcohnia quinoae]|uniref:Type II secretion system F family protein n=1 Tax=Fredinandcohnia quinoae TaxID=2918902 RepID=A0AAW5E6Q3_9BACI|nr:type II secretion system F family protein [Fredinandcohnia sp. SECRCQ15]MCH1626584.1 type II secretion system F family protein [Fredinandcohnia sp. SECRCQ15]
MPRFKYQGRDTKGKRSGKVHAPSKREAITKLRDSGIRVIQMDEVPETLFTKDLSIGNPVKLQDFTIFLRQFSTLIKAGITVVDSMAILASQSSSKALKRALVEVELDLREGISLSKATAKHKKVFSTLFTNMVKVGEIGGTLDETLERLAVHFEKQHKTRQKVKSAMTYPAVIGVVTIAVVIFLLTSVVPTFVTMFSGFGADLPPITTFVLHSSEFMQSYWWVVILIFFLFYLSIIMIKQNKESKYYYDYLVLKIPVFGKMLQKAVLARMTRTLSSLLSSSVPILQTLAVVETIVENEVVAGVLKQSRDSLEKGKSMTIPMKKHWAFPPLITQMIVIGENTGSLDEMLGKVATFYEDEVENATDKLKSLIEPIMIVILSGIVGVIVTSIMVPMFDIFNKIQ